jgi:hypothetical protein
LTVGSSPDRVDDRIDHGLHRLLTVRRPFPQPVSLPDPRFHDRVEGLLYGLHRLLDRLGHRLDRLLNGFDDRIYRFLDCRATGSTGLLNGFDHGSTVS